jgi:hypothetical protein
MITVLCSRLLALIGGLSRVFFSGTYKDSRAFPAAAKYYPLADEQWNAIRDPEEFATELYKVYRCNLVHSLGLNLEWSDVLDRWEVVELPILRKVTRHPDLPLTEAHLTELDLPSGRPTWLRPTLYAEDGVIRLNAEALYWGVRRLVRILVQDPKLSADAEEFARAWFQRSHALPSGHAVMSSAPMILQTTGDAIRATLGPITSVASHWDSDLPK